MHNIIVCDDNVVFKDALVMILNKYAGLYDVNVIGFSDGREMLDFCNQNQFDIIYLDIELGKENGMDFAKTIKSINPQCLIIYISAYDYYYKQMVQAEPFRFLPKDLSDVQKWEKKVIDTLELAMRRIKRGNVFSYEVGRKQYNIELEKIFYFYSVARKIHIVGRIGNAPDCFYGKIDELQEKLEKLNENFIRISKSYIINLKYSARVIDKNQVKVANKILSVTPKYRDVTEKRITTYWIT